MAHRFVLTAAVIATLAPAPRLAAQIATVDLSRIDEIFAPMANRESPGCAVAVARDGALAFARGYGMADIKHGTPITTRTLMNLGSVTKQFTAAAVNLLAAEGRLSLDDDVRKYVPEVPRYDVPITIRQLMNHTSGVRDYTVLAVVGGMSENDLQNAEVLAFMGRQRRTDFTPGTQWAYTNGGYFLLATIVERVSGTPLPAFVDERLLRPLGMTSTAFRTSRDSPKGSAVGYRQDGKTWRAVDAEQGVVGAGGLFSTAEDMVLWQLNMESPRLGGAKWAELTNARGTLTDGTPILYGAGLFHATFAGQPTIEHTGALPGNTAFVERFLALRLSIVVLCNRESPGVGNVAGMLGRRVAALYVGAPPAGVAPAASPSVALTAQQQASYVGMFYNNQVPSAWPITVDGGKMFWAYDRELVPIGDSRFQLAGTAAKMTFRGTDTLIFDQAPFPTGGGAWLPRPTYVRVSTARRDLREYAGAYVSSELRVRWNVQVKDTALIIDRPRGDSYWLYRVFEDGFRSPSLGMSARFIRDEKGQVSVMEVSVGQRVWHLRLERER